MSSAAPVPSVGSIIRVSLATINEFREQLARALFLNLRKILFSVWDSSVALGPQGLLLSTSHSRPQALLPTTSHCHFFCAPILQFHFHALRGSCLSSETFMPPGVPTFMPPGAPTLHALRGPCLPRPSCPQGPRPSCPQGLQPSCSQGLHSNPHALRDPCLPRPPCPQGLPATFMPPQGPGPA
jgi:hypothetical protein